MLGQAIAGLNRTQGSIQFASLDPLITAYRSQYGAKLDWGGAPTRSRAFDEYSSATGNLMNAPNWISLFGTVSNPSTDPSCAVPGLADKNEPVQGIGVAVRLLTSTVAADGTNYPAGAYVCVVDGGLVNSGGAGYDGHGGLINATATNLWNTLTALSRAIRTSATDTTPGKINLDDTLVIINTEFGRTPDLPTSTGDGRDHWPEGYASVLIGGPITTSAVVGRIDTASGYAVAPAYTPTDFRAACLMAAGVEPIVPGVTFSVAQLFGNTITGDSVARTKVRTEILGVP